MDVHKPYRSDFRQQAASLFSLELEHGFDESFRAVGYRRHPHRDGAWTAARWLSKWATFAIVDRSRMLFLNVVDTFQDLWRFGGKRVFLGIFIF